jgi:phospholipid/cholesterol/gamma-HCH transport system substrate-binding protein
MRLAAIVAAGSLALTGCQFSLYNANLPGGASLGSHPITITAHFADVLDLVPQSAVKVNDVSVGKVESISLDGWFAKVKLAINGDVDLPANAFASLEQTSLLGEKYIELQPPTDGSAPSTTRLATGDDIPIQHTGRNPEVEEVLGALSLVLNGGGLQQIHTIVDELDKALNGKTTQARDLLTQLVTLTGDLDKQKDDITTAITNVNNLAATLNAQKAVITTTLDTLPGALKILSDDRDQLVGLLQSLSTLGQTAGSIIQQSQTNFVSALQELDPVATQLADSGKNLTTSLKILLTFPFPPNVLQSIHGDYVNAAFTLNLNLGDLLTDLTATGLSTSSASDQPVDTSSMTPLEKAAASLPDIPGVGGS